MNLEPLSGLRLVGGTALALQIGHRKSIDLDLFGEIDFEQINTAKLFSGFDKVETLKRSPNINIFSINNIKVDFVNYTYPWIEQIRFENNNLRLAHITDIAAMKLAAITGRGSKKDFFDIYFLLKEYTLKQLMTFYNQKYFDGSDYLVLKSLTYFNDANFEKDPVMLSPVSWGDVKGAIVEKVREYVIG